jgi:rRNA maturation endonuclease Nob1
MTSLYYCSACHYIYPATTARDKAFCPDCGQPKPRPATEEEVAQYKADRESVLPLSEQ